MRFILILISICYAGLASAQMTVNPLYPLAPPVGSLKRSQTQDSKSQGDITPPKTQQERLNGESCLEKWPQCGAQIRFHLSREKIDLTINNQLHHFRNHFKSAKITIDKASLEYAMVNQIEEVETVQIQDIYVDTHKRDFPTYTFILFKMEVTANEGKKYQIACPITLKTVSEGYSLFGYNFYETGTFYSLNATSHSCRFREYGFTFDPVVVLKQDQVQYSYTEEYASDM